MGLRRLWKDKFRTGRSGVDMEGNERRAKIMEILRKMNQVVVKEDCASTWGMVNKVRHLVEVTNA